MLVFESREAPSRQNQYVIMSHNEKKGYRLISTYVLATGNATVRYSVTRNQESRLRVLNLLSVVAQSMTSPKL
jgi:hypothetical protein